MLCATEGFSQITSLLIGSRSFLKIRLFSPYFGHRKSGQRCVILVRFTAFIKFCPPPVLGKVLPEEFVRQEGGVDFAQLHDKVRGDGPEQGAVQIVKDHLETSMYATNEMLYPRTIRQQYSNNYIVSRKSNTMLYSFFTYSSCRCPL